MTGYTLNDDLLSRVSANLANFERRSINDDELRQAAVAIVIVAQPGKTDGSILLTLRPQHINRHKGQFALPGGRMDTGESELDAARRELHEELGVDLGPETYLGTLDDYATRSGFRITPLVFRGGEALAIKPDPDEVEQVFHIPLAELDSPEIPHLAAQENSDHPVLSIKYLPAINGSVYAPTAAILYQFREVALRGNATRVAHFDQPRFAWE